MKKYAVIYGAGEAEGVEVIICRFWTVIDIWFVNKNMTGSVQVLHKHSTCISMRVAYKMLI